MPLPRIRSICLSTKRSKRSTDSVNRAMGGSGYKGDVVVLERRVRVTRAARRGEWVAAEDGTPLAERTPAAQWPGVRTEVVAFACRFDRLPDGARTDLEAAHRLIGRDGDDGFGFAQVQELDAVGTTPDGRLAHRGVE